MALSLGSLVIMSYGAIAVAFSVPVTEEMAQANAVAEDTPDVGLRAVVRPVVNPADVDTLREDGVAAWLLTAEREAAVPAMAEGVALVEALAYVSVLHNGSYAEPQLALTNLTAAGEDGAPITYNATVNLTDVAGGRSGYLVKTSSERNVTFVPLDGVLGTVDRFESPAWSYGLVVMGTIGFVTPLVALIATHRPTGTRGLGGARAVAVCPECRRPVAPESGFCTACGAYLPGKDS